MSLSNSPKRRADLSPLVSRVIDLAYHAEEHDRSRSRDGETAFFEAVAVLAVQNVGFRGVLAPDPDLYKPIEDLARKHLDWIDGKKEFREALDRVKRLEDRDALETAHTRIVGVSDAAYYYTGLAFGLTLADLVGRR